MSVVFAFGVHATVKRDAVTQEGVSSWPFLASCYQANTETRWGQVNHFVVQQKYVM